MTKIKALILSSLIAAAALLAPAPARAVECDQLSTGMGICLPRYGTDFDQWATATINAFTLINSSGVINSTTTIAFLKELYLKRIGGLTGEQGIRISSAIFQDSGFSSTWASSMTVTAGDGLNVKFAVTSASAAFGSTTKSTFTATGMLLVSPAGVQWPDGTISTSALTAGLIVLGSTKTMNIPQATGSNTVFANCVLGSSVTFTKQNSESSVIVGFVGPISNGSAGRVQSIFLLQDGAFVTGESSVSDGISGGGMTTCYDPTGSKDCNISFTHNLGPISAGSHTFCLGASASAGTWQFPGRNNTINSFWVREFY